MHIVGNIHEKIGHIRRHGVQHPGKKKQQRHKQDHHFRNKGERGFVQLRHGLERTNGQADEQTKPQNRGRHQQRRFQRLPGQFRYHFWCHVIIPILDT